MVGIVGTDGRVDEEELVAVEDMDDLNKMPSMLMSTKKHTGTFHN
jgi:hypothetical protein